MLWTITLRTATFVLAGAFTFGTASACEAPRITQASMATLARTMGSASFQMDPSTVIVELIFTSPDKPPSLATLYMGGDSRFADGVIAEAKQLRTACASEVAPVKSIEARRLGVHYLGVPGYRAAEPRLRTSLELNELVRIVKDLKSERVRFDTREMGCPFWLRFSPYRPYLPNRVLEAGSTDQRRAPLLEWLREVTLDLPPDMMVTAIGRESAVTVPCVVLDLS